MKTKLKKLLNGIPFQQIKGSKEIEVTGVCANSKLVAPGNLFIARKGQAVNGATYIPEAISAGAIAIITDLYDPLIDKQITQIIHSNPAEIEGLIAARYYQFPSDELFMVGITGTNGKTTTSFLTKHLLDTLYQSKEENQSCGLIGTIKYIIGPHQYLATRTTPDVTSTHKMLREMIVHNSPCAIMEVTSHGLDQNRVDCVDFDTVVFTNLTLDHLDYHQTMENYFLAKKKLFSSLNPKKIKPSHKSTKTAIINIDSPWGEKFIENCPGKIFTYGIEKPADLSVEKMTLTPTGTELLLKHQENSCSFFFPLVGRFNVYNCLASVAIAFTHGFSLTEIGNALEKTPVVAGRLERVPNDLNLKIFVDFAHTDDALLNVLTCLNEFKKGRLISVFGCGGNRDANKRPKMAAVTEAHSDVTILTSDNPRQENPAEIARQASLGFKGNDYIIELDRYRAIEIAIEMATPDDTILIAGRGHETQQIFAYTTIDFKDSLVAAQICEKLAKKLATTK